MKPLSLVRRLCDSRGVIPRSVLLFLTILLLCLSPGCKRGGFKSGEAMYVSAAQANLRDRVATVYNKVGMVQNGDRVEVVDRQKRFLRVRTTGGVEGWIEQRSLVSEDVFKGFEALKKENQKVPVQAHGIVRRALNMHLTPERDSDHLYQMKEEEKVEILKRASAPKSPAPKASPLPPLGRPQPSSSPARSTSVPVPKTTPIPSPSPVEPPVMEDWWLVRDSQGRVGWVLAQIIDIDVPLEVAQYSEGERVMGAFVLNHVQDDGKQIPQYLVLMSDGKGGQPYDFDHIRVFTWNTKRHRYETAYRERNFFGVFPAVTGSEDFGKEGVEPVFTIQVKDVSGQTIARKYRMIGPIVRRVFAPGETSGSEAKLARPEQHKKSGAKSK